MNIYEQALLAICIWREARGQTLSAKYGVAWSIRNRVKRPGWWGNSWISVILHPWQYSSFNAGDPNSVKWPDEDDQSFKDCMIAADDAYNPGHYIVNQVDPINGATNYYDKSLDNNPPSWAGKMTWICDIDSLHFYR